MGGQSQVIIIAKIKYRLMKELLCIKEYSNNYNTYI